MGTAAWVIVGVVILAGLALGATVIGSQLPPQEGPVSRPDLPPDDKVQKFTRATDAAARKNRTGKYALPRESIGGLADDLQPDAKPDEAARRAGFEQAISG